MSSSAPSYLPSLPVQSYAPAPNRKMIAEQPMTSQAMSLQALNTPRQPQTVDGVQRLRGGCIPCPVRSSIIN
ncbi:hypothetical protein HYPSUDRAFT_423547 [Hypholoma sublateritium FD-334 SS-4]|uniref:Uncharacterized protein n=1 Tax=Hypholoma sublateritium (strain FD-334 SS-4) TaxID=945553 RepID=A0A0D2P341_HYPSF|nr:hypothetical protein HYPSUDRAFT_423547 [Hypholoma sublateritium FD-334 SS-4]